MNRERRPIVNESSLCVCPGNRGLNEQRLYRLPNELLSSVTVVVSLNDVEEGVKTSCLHPRNLETANLTRQEWSYFFFRGEE